MSGCNLLDRAIYAEQPLPGRVAGYIDSALEEEREDRVKGKKDVPIVSLRGDNRCSFT